MPIRPELKSLYPENWDEISRRIRFERAGGRREWCGAENYQPQPESASHICPAPFCRRSGACVSPASTSCCPSCSAGLCHQSLCHCASAPTRPAAALVLQRMKSLEIPIPDWHPGRPGRRAGRLRNRPASIQVDSFRAQKKSTAP